MPDKVIPPTSRQSSRLCGLWLARELPFPMESGDRVYSAQLAQALAQAGVDLTMSGLHTSSRAILPTDWPLRFLPLERQRRSTGRALLSAMPLVAATYATPAYRQLLSALSLEPWDFVVFDQYGMGWAVDYFRKPSVMAPRPILVHVAHDHETSLCRDLYRSPDTSLFRRIGLWQNYVKVLRFERELVASMDLVTAITEEDAQRFSADISETNITVIKPGYAGVTSTRTHITAETPRRAVIMGSYQWVAKQDNLRRFVAPADAIFAAHGVELDVIGAIPADLRAELQNRSRAVRFHGYVADVQPLLANARIAIVPELIGGGFKLKFLDYIFGRLPVATLEQAAAGVTESLRKQMFCCASVAELADVIVRNIDNLLLLNEMQAQALATARALFQWSDRGLALKEAIEQRLSASSSPTERGHSEVIAAWSQGGEASTTVPARVRSID